MIEAKVTCKCGSIRLTDLDLYLTKDMSVYMPEAKARSSRDLQRAWRTKGVDVQYVERFQERRDPTPGGNSVFPPPSGMAFLPEPSREQVLFDPDEVARRVVDLLGESPVQNHIRVEVGRQLKDVLQGMESRIINAVVDRVASVIRSSVAVTGAVASHAGGPSTKPSGTVEAEDVVPVFIPSKIGHDDMKADFEVQSERGDDSGLSDAAAALRSARKAGKKRPTE